MFGHSHLDVAASYMNIGNVYNSQGKYEEALVQYRRSLDIKFRVLDHSHPDVANSKYNIADLHEKQGDVEEAKKLFLECEQIYAGVYGQDHSETLDAARRAQNVGQYCGGDGDEEEEGEGLEEEVGVLQE